MPNFISSKKISPENGCAIAGSDAAASEVFTLQARLFLGGCCRCPAQGNWITQPGGNCGAGHRPKVWPQPAACRA